MYIIYAKFMYRYTNVKIDIFEKEFFFLQKGVVVGCWDGVH